MRWALASASAMICELKYRRDVRTVLVLKIFVMLVGVQIVVAVGQSQTALEQVRNVLCRVVKIRRNENAKQPVGVKIRGVQRVDIRPKLRTKYARELGLVLNGADLAKLALYRIEPAFFDGILVEVGGVIVADELLFGLRRFTGRGYDVGRPLADLVKDDVERAERRAVGRYLSRVEPAAISIAEKVVARADGLVHPGNVDAGWLGPGSGRHRRENKTGKESY
jgi:hypothetical protein